jgi:hypothetical protein
MSNKFKVGDYVRYIRHSVEKDKEYFNIGKIYSIERVRDTGSFFLKDVSLQVFIDQIEYAFHDTKINRVLYPELKPKDGFLVPKEN